MKLNQIVYLYLLFVISIQVCQPSQGQPYTRTQLESDYSAFLQSSTRAIKHTESHLSLSAEAAELKQIKKQVIDTYKELSKLTKKNPPLDEKQRQIFNDKKNDLIRSMLSLQHEFKAKVHDATLKLTAPSKPMDPISLAPPAPLAEDPVEDLPAEAPAIDPIKISDWKTAIATGDIRTVKKIFKAVQKTHPERIPKLLQAAAEVTPNEENGEIGDFLHKLNNKFARSSGNRTIIQATPPETLEVVPARPTTKIKGSDLIEAIKNNDTRLIQAALQKMNPSQKQALEIRIKESDFNPGRHPEVDKLLRDSGIKIPQRHGQLDALPASITPTPKRHMSFNQEPDRLSLTGHARGNAAPPMEQVDLRRMRSTRRSSDFHGVAPTEDCL